MNTRQKLYLLLIILASCFGCDQVSKRIAKNTLEYAPGKSYLADTFRLRYAENSGAFLSLGSGFSESIRTLLFEVLSGGLLIGLLIYILVNRQLDRKHAFALSLIFAGGFSNLFDRLVNDGRVIDFMNMGVGSLRTGIFNWADVVIMTGMFIILALSFLSKRTQESHATETDSLEAANTPE